MYLLDVVVVSALLLAPPYWILPQPPTMEELFHRMAAATAATNASNVGVAASISPTSSLLSLLQQLATDDSNCSTLLIAYLAALVVWMFYSWLQAPFNVSRPPNKARKTRGQRPSEFPPPFPNGWFLVSTSDNLKKGQAKEVQALGKHMVLFRTMTGSVGLLDAFCPHLGANLGVAGEVKGDCLRCCFHGWEFDTEGVCHTIPGTTTIPTKSTLGSYLVKEVNQCIFFWHHSDGEDATPWDLEEVPQLTSPKSGWYESGRTFCHVHAHIQELPENGADAAHLNVLHKNFVVEMAPRQVTHNWSAKWKVDEDAPHKSSIHLTQAMCILGYEVPGTHVDAYIQQIGPGIVRLRLETPLGPLYTYECVTPHKTTTQMVTHLMFCCPTIPRFVGKFLMWAFEAQFQRDAPIWESKKFESRPVISKADGPILAFRRWYKQFYSPTSLEFSDALAKEHMMDW